jgi:hypothetical protein
MGPKLDSLISRQLVHQDGPCNEAKAFHLPIKMGLLSCTWESHIYEICYVCCNQRPFRTLRKAIFYKRLKENLLTIIQICDDDHIVQFSKNECNVFDENSDWIMGGLKTFDNCHGFGPSPFMSYNRAKLDVLSHGTKDWDM